MKRLIPLIAIGVIALLATQAWGSDRSPAPTVNGVVAPTVGQVVGQAKLLPDGTCDLDGGKFQMEATEVAAEGDPAPAVELNDRCAWIYVGTVAPPSTSPGGVTVAATP